MNIFIYTRLSVIVSKLLNYYPNFPASKPSGSNGRQDLMGQIRGGVSHNFNAFLNLK